MHKSENGSVATALNSEQLEVILRINREADQIYQDYGVEEPPGKHSKMPTKAKVAFFVTLLQHYDSGSDKNIGLPLPVRLFQNRRYNNVYKHAAENFKGRELMMLTKEMQRLKIGDAFRAGRLPKVLLVFLL
jgi:hypothetical protein